MALLNKYKHIILFVFLLSLLIFPVSYEDGSIVLSVSHAWSFSEWWDSWSIAGWVEQGIEALIKGLIHYAFVLPFAFFTVIGAKISAVFIDPAVLNIIFSGGTSEALYQIWSVVRDFSNLFLIFILLFSAMATIFQIQKYHIIKGNVLLMIIIMAFLVNFSWPITRVIIDSGNITMYYLVDLFVEAPEGKPKGDILLGTLGDESNLISKIAMSGDEYQDAYDKASITEQFASALFLFHLGLVFFVIAALFMIRTAMFVILLVFSPFGLVASVFPGTKKYSKMWWSSIIKWTLIGPILVFIIYLSTRFMITMQDVSKSLHGFGANDKKNIADGIVFLSAIVMLWSGVMTTQKLGGSLSSVVFRRAPKFRNFLFKKHMQFIGGAATVTKSVAKSGIRTLDNKKFNNKIATTLGNIKGLNQRMQDFSNKTKNKYDSTTKKTEAFARGGYHAHSVENSEISRYSDDLKNTSTERLISIASSKNNNEYERKAARELLGKKIKDENDKSQSRIKTLDQLHKALQSVNDDFRSVNSILNSIDSSIFEDINESRYSSLRNAILNQRSVNKLDDKIMKSGNIHVVYNYHKNKNSSDAVYKGLSNVKTASDLAKQEELLNQAQADEALANYIKNGFLAYPSIKTELLKKLSSKSRQIVNSL